MRTFLSKDAARQSHFRKAADKALKQGPWSVTFHRPLNAETSVAVNDYYSDAPYWWPDPNKPDAPYIRKDGERNPKRFETNRRHLGDMSEAVLSLGSGAFLLGEPKYATRAAELLHTWFIDPKTRMNPHLDYGQAIRGRNTGRGAGIIDTVSLIYCAQGAALANLDPTLQTGLQQWFSQYLHWLTTSKPGLDEKKAGNNHATWWTAQVAAYSSFSANAELQKMAWDRYRTWLIPSQVQPDGSCPKEEARTRSLSYSSMNLDGFSILCRLGGIHGQSLWSPIEKSFHYLLPFVLEPTRWKKQQIAPYEQDKVFFPALAGLGLKSDTLLSAYRKLPRTGSPWVQLVDLLVASA